MKRIAKKVSLGDMDVVVGLEWTALSNDVPERKALSEYMSKSKARRGIIIRHEGVTVVGRLDNKTGSTPSANALLALASQKKIEDIGGTVADSSEVTSAEHNWIVVEPVYQEGSDIFWMGAAKNGVPLPGSDILGTKEEIIHEVLNLIMSNDKFTVFTKDKDVRFNVVGQVSNVDERSFADLTRSASSKKATPRLFSIATLLAVGILLAAFLAVGLWFAYSKWDDAQKQKAAALAAAAQQKAASAQAAASLAQYEEEVKKAVLDGLEQGMQEVETSLAGAGPNETISSWSRLIYSVDSDQGGWTIDHFECANEEATPKCTVFLKRGDMGVNRVLLDIHPDAVIEGDEATFVVSGPAISPRSINMQALGSATDFSRTTMSQLQIIRTTDITHTVAESKDVTKEVAIPAPATAMATAADAAGAAPEPPKPVIIQLGFGSGSLALTGTALWQLTGIARELDTPSIRAKDLTVRYDPISGVAQWTLNVEYLVRTLPQPIIPVVQFGEKNIVVKLPEKYVSTVPVDEGESVSASSVTSTSSLSSSSDAGDDPNDPNASGASSGASSSADASSDQGPEPEPVLPP